MDCRYDEVNGNRRTRFAEAVLFFNQMGWISANDRSAFAEIGWLFDNL